MATVSDPLLKKGPFDTVIAAPEFSNILHAQAGDSSNCLGLENSTKVDDLLGIQLDIA